MSEPVYHGLDEALQAVIEEGLAVPVEEVKNIAYEFAIWNIANMDRYPPETEKALHYMLSKRGYRVDD